MVAHTVIEHHVEWARVAFEDRAEAGEQLATVLVEAPLPDALVLALPRGGIPVAVPMSRALECELRTLGVRKLPLPMSPEMGFGAVTLDGTVWLNEPVMASFGITPAEATHIAEKVRRELERRAEAFGDAEPRLEIAERRVFLVDDGLATGFTMLAACQTVARAGAASITVAVPVAPVDSVRAVARHCDELLCLYAQDSAGFAVASYYRFFPDLGDDEVRSLLGGARR